jgi:hypothetical protein
MIEFQEWYPYFYVILITKQKQFCTRVLQIIRVRLKSA